MSLFAEAGHQHQPVGHLGPQRLQRLRQRLDPVVAVEFRLGLVAQVLELEDLLAVRFVRPADGDAHAHARKPPCEVGRGAVLRVRGPAVGCPGGAG
jgi:hypothetical protein